MIFLRCVRDLTLEINFRILLIEGHRPERFYIMLEGEALRCTSRAPLRKLGISQIDGLIDQTQLNG